KIYEEADSIKIILADDGLGIPKHLTKEVFNPFVVGDESRNHKQGSGLGLAITKRIVQAHGGSIRLVLPPEKNYKTQFEITFLKES
ncbi:sensor histidine kinase, partial [Zhenhengia yiwuensis]|uniref:sensor histidine kinase n=1 Tax=Zhenhengia yiwuensis TaxID=2763666 RepID=UPI002A75E63B